MWLTWLFTVASLTPRIDRGAEDEEEPGPAA